MSKLIQIFKSGKHTAMSGAALEFSESDLVASAKAYDPALHEAPIVVGHPKADAPAYGWVKSLSYTDGLDAEPHQVDEAFAEMVQAGRFKKVSASFYTPDSPSNPVPGVYYLRHVGFLGAQPPAIKGLKQAEFADAGQGVIEFADWGDMQNASMWRRLRDFFIDQFGLDKADSVIPDFAVSSLEDDARKEDMYPNFSEGSALGKKLAALMKDKDVSAEQMGNSAGIEAGTVQQILRGDIVAPPRNRIEAFAKLLDVSADSLWRLIPADKREDFSETQPKGDEMSAEDKARLEALEDENKKLKADQAAFAEAEKKRKTDAAHADHLAFAESMVAAGKLLPVNKAIAVATLDLIASQDAPLEFGEGDTKASLTVDSFKATLTSSPRVVEFGEVGSGDKNNRAGMNFVMPVGYSADPDKIATHHKALEYAERNKCDYVSAVKAVEQA